MLFLELIACIGILHFQLSGQGSGQLIELANGLIEISSYVLP
jgi:hypothetical protein